MLSYSKDTKSSRLSANGYFKDTSNALDSWGVVNTSGGTKTQSTNNGYIKRKKKIKNSKWVFFSINLHTDITTLRQYIQPNTKLEFELHRTTDQFSLLSPYPISCCEI